MTSKEFDLLIAMILEMLKATPHNIAQKKSLYDVQKRTAKFTLTCLQRQT